MKKGCYYREILYNCTEVMSAANNLLSTFSNDVNGFEIIADENGNRILVKSILSKNPGAGEIARLENELQFAEMGAIQGVRRVYGAGDKPNTLNLEWIEGQNLFEWMAEAHGLLEKVKLVRDIAEILVRVHNAGIVYKNISPSNILVKSNGELVLIDMSLSSVLVSKSQSHNSIRDNGNPDFIAPEQTGRINRLVDHRADLYSLGCLMYYVFTGEVPFRGPDLLEKIHAQIAQNPIAIHEIHLEIPIQLSRIVAKSMSKNPEDRYQSAYGLHFDLNKCAVELEKSQNIEEFPLQTQDYRGELVFSNQLFGRERESAELKSIYESSVKGEKQLLTISGIAGSGKTSLVHQLYEPVFKSRGMLLSGKFDKYQKDIPYFGFQQVLSEFVQNILSLDSKEIETWTENIRNATYPIGNVLTQLQPQLSVLVGNHPPLPELNGPEAQNRFNYAILNFIKSLAAPGSPMVLFLDDVQWADNSSIQLVKVLLNQTELKNILIILSFRENEIPPTHPLAELIREFNGTGVHVSDIHLESLSKETVNDLLADSLQTSPSACKELSEIVFKKSQGNVLFVHQFLKSANVNGFIKFDFEKRTWTWNIDEIIRLNVDGDIDALLKGFISKLPDETLSLLSVASCLGGTFQQEYLSHVVNESSNQVKKILQPALAAGLVIESHKNIIFGNERIQKLLYEAISDTDKALHHHKIAMFLDQKDTEQIAVFDRVFHWNRAVDAVQNDAEKLHIAKMNVAAGNKAKSSVAFEEAFFYFKNAISLLPKNHWTSEYALSLDLFSSAAETSYLLGKHDLSEKYVDSVMANANNTEDKSRAIIYRIRAYTAENKLIEAMNAGFDLLDELGVKLPRNPSKFHIALGLIRARILLRGKSNTDIFELPTMKDQRVLTVMDVIYTMLAPAYFALPDFLGLGVFKMIQLSLKYGLGPKSPYAFLGYGYIYSAFLGNIKAGTKYGNIGFSLHKNMDTRAMSASFHGIYHALTNHWIMHLPDTLQGLKEGYKVGLETGDIEYTSYLAHNIIYHSLYSGKNLDEVLEEGKSLLGQVQSFNMEIVLYRIRIFLQSIQDLTSIPSEPGFLEGEWIRESQNKYKPEKQNHILFHNLYMQKMLVALIYGKKEDAWEYIKEMELYNHSVQGSALFPLLHYYRPLAISAIYDRQPEQKGKFLKIIKKDLKKLKQYKEFSEGNFSQKYWLVMAEFARIQGDSDSAQKYFFKALREARQSRIIIDEALCWERAGDYYHTEGLEQVAEFYINNAYIAYKRWGAAGKVEQLNAAHPHLASNEYAVTERESNDNLDLATVVKTYNAITGEIVMENLLKKLMQIMVENAGAQRGVLVREENGQRYILAVRDKEDSETEVLLNEPINTSRRISKTIVNYTANSENFVVLDNASTTRPYNTESYIRENQIKSVICMPIVQKGKIFGYLYLENNLVSGAFTKARISLLKILSTQAAVSLENAELYDSMSNLNHQLKNEILEKEVAKNALMENEKRLEEYNLTLEQKVDERTKEISDQRDLIEQEKQKSDALLLNILPEETAEELKKFGKAIPRRYGSVTVLFTDFVSFSKISESVSADVLVNEIHHYYSAFDRIIGKYKLEKIKTIGDSFMCVSGLPVEIPDHAFRAVSAALDIQKFIEEEKEKRKKTGEIYFEIRIGLHTGPVVSGIVGIKKFAFDIWGDTVNYASRMESASEPGKINISGSTYEKIKDDFNCTHRGKIAVKSKGEIDMYFVEGAN